jgi:hypothetical protein
LDAHFHLWSESALLLAGLCKAKKRSSSDTRWNFMTFGRFFASKGNLVRSLLFLSPSYNCSRHGRLQSFLPSRITYHVSFESTKTSWNWRMVAGWNDVTQVLLCTLTSPPTNGSIRPVNSLF